MRAAQLLRWGIGTTAGLVVLGAVGGCGMSSSGTSIAGASPVGDSNSGRTTTPIASTSNSASTSTSTAFATTPNVEPATTTATYTPNSAASTPAAVSTTTPTTTPTAANTPTTTSTATSLVCTTADLGFQVFEPSQPTPSSHASTPTVPIGPGLGALRGTRAQQFTLVFTNVSHAACTVSGYPSVDFLQPGTRGPLSAPNSYSPSTKVTNVRLSPGGAAQSSITFTTNSYTNPRGSRCNEVVSVRVYIPGSTKALVSGARDNADHRIADFYVCGHKVVVWALQPK
jgi:uncharacterized protein DUF4232